MDSHFEGLPVPELFPSSAKLEKSMSLTNCGEATKQIQGKSAPLEKTRVFKRKAFICRVPRCEHPFGFPPSPSVLPKSPVRLSQEDPMRNLPRESKDTQPMFRCAVGFLRCPT